MDRACNGIVPVIHWVSREAGVLKGRETFEVGKKFDDFANVRAILG